jgi:hypothetical protein
MAAKNKGYSIISYFLAKMSGDELCSYMTAHGCKKVKGRVKDPCDCSLPLRADLPPSGLASDFLPRNGPSFLPPQNP